MLTWLPRPAAAAVGAAVLLTAAAALAQLPSAEQGAYNAVDDAVSAFRSASGRDEMTRAAGRILDAAENAVEAFATADRGRDAAADRYSSAVRELSANLVVCENGYRCGENEGVLYFDGWAATEARDFDRGAAASEANVAYIEAVGISGAGEARERAARLLRIGNRTRGLRGRDGWSRRNALVIEPWNTESRATTALHDRAISAHVAANRAALDALGRAGRTLSTAAGRLTDGYYPATRAAEVTREAAALDRAVAAAADPDVSNDSDATDRALDALLIAARGTFIVLESHVQLVEQGAQQYERDPEPQVPDGLPAVRRPPDIEVAPAADLDAWANQVRDAVMEVERAAGEAEETAAGSGYWFSRFTGCENTYYRLVRSVSRVQDLTIGSGRPDFIPGGAGSEAWRQLSERIDEARRRARAACSSIEPPR